MRSSGLHTVAPPNTGVMESWSHVQEGRFVSFVTKQISTDAV